MVRVLRHPCILPTLLLLFGLWSYSPVRAQHFTNCTLSPLNATVIVPGDVTVEIGKDRTLEAGDEIALFTRDGQCVGWSRWQNTSFSIAVASTDRHGSIGYPPDAQLQYRIWDASAKKVLKVDARYRSCRADGPCRSNGRYARNAVYLLAALTTRSAPLEADYKLSEFFPNPFHDRAQLTLRVQRDQEVTIALYNVLGQRLRLLHEGPVEAGRTYTFTIERRGLSSGSYFCRVQGETFSATRRAVLVK